MDTENEFVKVTVIPLKLRIQKAMVIFLPVCGLSMYGFIRTMLGYNPSSDYWVCIGWFLGGLAWSYYVFHPKEFRTYSDSPEGAAAKRKDEEEAAVKSVELEERITKQLNIWWVRYLGAGLLIWFASYLYDSPAKNGKFIAVAVLLFAAYCARELVLWGIGAGIVIWILSNLASVPTNVAVIIGALIIAGAIAGNKK